MKRVLTFACVVAGSVALAALASKPQRAAQPTPQQAAMKSSMPNKAAIEKSLQDLEQKINDAVVKADAAAFKSYVATEAWGADANGFMSMAEFMKMFKPGMAKITNMKLSGFKVLWVDDATAVLTYMWQGQGTFMDQPVTSPTYCSTVYTKRGDKWVALFHQETPAAPAPPKK